MFVDYKHVQREMFTNSVSCLQVAQAIVLRMRKMPANCVAAPFKPMKNMQSIIEIDDEVLIDHYLM